MYLGSIDVAHDGGSSSVQIRHNRFEKEMRVVIQKLREHFTGRLPKSKRLHHETVRLCLFRCFLVSFLNTCTCLGGALVVRRPTERPRRGGERERRMRGDTFILLKEWRIRSHGSTERQTPPSLIGASTRPRPTHQSPLHSLLVLWTLSPITIICCCCLVLWELHTGERTLLALGFPALRLCGFPFTE